MTLRPLSLFSCCALLFLLVGLGSCASHRNPDVEVRQVFDGFKLALMSGHAKEALGYIDQPSLDFLLAAISHPAATGDANAELEGLIQGTAEKFTPGGIQAGFTLDQPLQRILDQNWVNPDSLDRLDIGPVGTKGDQARTEVLWQGRHTTFQLYFTRQDGQWKIDLRNAIPYAQLALQADRTMHNETDEQQLQRLLARIPTF